jgi:tRNA-binding protein
VKRAEYRLNAASQNETGKTRMITFEEFEKVEIRVGTIMEVADNVKTKKPAYILTIDFGSDMGIKTSSAQLATSYQKEELINRKILAVTNFAPKNVAGVLSEVLVLAVPTMDGNLSLVEPTKREVENGARLH